MSRYCLLASVVLAATACGTTEPDVPTELKLVRVDGSLLPGFMGTTSTGRTMVVTRGTLSGSSQGADCSYSLHLEGSTGAGAPVDISGFLDEHPCTLLNNGPKELTLQFNRADVPKTSHRYRFE